MKNWSHSICLLLLPVVGGTSCAGRTPAVFSSRAIVVGGIGDSGTRGIRALLELLGVAFCKKHSLSGDDDWIQRATHRIVYDTHGGIFPFIEARKLRGNGSYSPGYFYSPDPSLLPGHNTMLHHPDPYSVYAKDLVAHEGFSMTDQHRAMLCDALVKSFSCSISSNEGSKGDGRPILWGFKEPRNALILREYASIFHLRPKFIHVIRDGRDVAYADLRAITSIVCSAYYGGYHVQSSLGRVREQAIKNSFVGKACASGGPTALVAWALLNLSIYEVGTASYGSDYLPIRIEDIALVEDPIPAITRVLDCLAVGNTSQLQAIAERVKGRHSAAFGGRRYSAEVRAQELGIGGAWKYLEWCVNRGHRSSALWVPH